MNQTRVVITTVGPYSLRGSELVNACVLYGTDYVDISGEEIWVQSNIHSMQEMAVKSGARIVGFCGFHVVPWDLTTYSMHEEFKNKYNQDLKKIQFREIIVAPLSGGTLHSKFEAHEIRKASTVQFPKNKDPWLFTPGETTSKNLNVINKNTILPHYDFNAKSWAGYFLYSGQNLKVIQRSNALVGYNTSLEYGEKFLYKNFMILYLYKVLYLIFFSLFDCKPLGCLVRKYLLPTSGESLPIADIKECRLNLWAEGTGTNGQKLYSEFHLHKEPGYTETARMLAESGLCFIFNNDQIKVGGGFWTPAGALNSVLLKRLMKTGTEYRFYNPDEKE